MWPFKKKQACSEHTNDSVEKMNKLCEELKEIQKKLNCSTDDISTWLNMVEQIKQDPYTIPVIGTSESAPTQANFIRLLEDPNPNLISVKKSDDKGVPSSLIWKKHLSQEEVEVILDELRNGSNFNAARTELRAMLSKWLGVPVNNLAITMEDCDNDEQWVRISVRYRKVIQ